MRCPFAMLLALVVFPLPFCPCLAANTSPEETLRASGVATDSRSLLTFFRARTPAPEQRHQADAAVKRLGDPSYTVRVQAVADLAAAGLQAVPSLRRARLSHDPEVRRRAAQALTLIRKKEAPLCRAALALLGLRAPRQAASTLLAFLPLAPDEETEEAVLAELLRLIELDAKADAQVRAALRDPLPERRAPLALLCCRAPGAEWRAAAVQLLEDADAHVRLRAVQGLVSAGDRRGLPVLIALLENGPGELVPMVRTMLGDVAGSSAIWSAEGGSRRDERIAWEKWYRKNGTELDLARPFGSERAYQDAAARREFQERRRRRVMRRLDADSQLLEQLKQQEASDNATVAAAEQRVRQLWRPGRERQERTNEGVVSLLARRRRP